MIDEVFKMVLIFIAIPVGLTIWIGLFWFISEMVYEWRTDRSIRKATSKAVDKWR